MSPSELGLFDEPVRVVAPGPPVDERTEGQRRRDRQLAAIVRGQHPLSVVLGPLPLHVEARRDGERAVDGSPRCGGCRFRRRLHGGARAYPKCVYGERTIRREDYAGMKVYTATVHPRASHGEGTDVASWWPACMQFEPIGDDDVR